MVEMREKDNVKETLKHIETLLNEHDKDQPYSDSEIRDILSGLRNIRDSLSKLQDRYLEIATDNDKLAYRLKAVEGKVDNWNKHDSEKREREAKYIDYAICTFIGSIVGLYISKLTGGH